MDVSLQHDPAARRRLLPVLFTATFMSALDTAVVGPALPALRQAYHVDVRAVGLVTSAYVLCLLLASALLASVSDRHGRRPVFLVSTAVFGIGSVLVALAPSFWWLVAARAVQGFGAGGISPTASAVIGDVYPPEERGKALGLLGATFGMAFVFGPPLAGLVLTFASWAWLFLINVPIAVYVLWLGARTLPRREPAHDAAPFDVAGLLVVASTLVVLTLGITRLADPFVGHLLWPFCLGAAVVGAAVLVPLERRASAPVLPMSLFANSRLALTYALTVGAGFGMGAVGFLASYATQAYGVEPRTAGFLLLPLVLASMAGAAGGGRAMHALGPKRLLLGGFGALAAGYAGMGFAAQGLWVFIVASLPVGLGVGIVVGGSLRSIAIDEAPASARTVAQGVINVATAVGTLTSASVVSAVADFAGGGAAGFAQAYAGVAAVMLVALGGTAMLRTR